MYGAGNIVFISVCGTRDVFYSVVMMTQYQWRAGELVWENWRVIKFHFLLLMAESDQLPFNAASPQGDGSLRRTLQSSSSPHEKNTWHWLTPSVRRWVDNEAPAHAALSCHTEQCESINSVGISVVMDLSACIVNSHTNAFFIIRGFYGNLLGFLFNRCIVTTPKWQRGSYSGQSNGKRSLLSASSPSGPIWMFSALVSFHQDAFLLFSPFNVWFLNPPGQPKAAVFVFRCCFIVKICRYMAVAVHQLHGAVVAERKKFVDTLWHFHRETDKYVLGKFCDWVMTFAVKFDGLGAILPTANSRDEDSFVGFTSLVGKV